MTTFKKPLKVSTPEGRRIFANIYQGADITIEIPFLEVVKKDKPAFAKKGIIRFSIEQSKYKDAITKIEKYLETLFLGELENDNTGTSVKAKSKPRRNKKPDPEIEIITD